MYTVFCKYLYKLQETHENCSVLDSCNERWNATLEEAFEVLSQFKGIFLALLTTTHGKFNLCPYISVFSCFRSSLLLQFTLEIRQYLNLLKYNVSILP